MRTLLILFLLLVNPAQASEIIRIQTTKSIDLIENLRENFQKGNNTVSIVLTNENT